MSWEVWIEWRGQSCLVGRLHAAERGPSVSFEYAPDWLKRPGAFAVDPTSLPLQAGAQHSPSLFGAIADCGPDRWGRMLIERAVRKKVLAQKPYRDIDYVLALDDSTRLGALRFRVDAGTSFMGRFGIKGPAARSILREVFTAVAAWRRTAARLRLKRATMEAYASAFEHELMDEARRLLREYGAGP
jgi:hypothetical protein